MSIVIDESTMIDALMRGRMPSVSPAGRTGAEIGIKMTTYAPRINSLITSWGRFPVLFERPQKRYATMNEDIIADRARKNNVLGEAMRAVKWHGLKHYLTLDHRRKQRMRVDIERKAKSTHPHMAKYRALWDEYRVALLTTDLETKHE